MIGYLAPQLRACDTSQMVVDDRNELVKGVSFAIAHREEKVRDFWRVRFAIRHPGSARIGHGRGAAQGEPDKTNAASSRAGNHIIRANRRILMSGAPCSALAGGSTQLHLREKHTT
jgi:hypothetical protein